MKIVFFDSDQMLIDFMKDKNFSGADVVFETRSAAVAANEYPYADIISGVTHNALPAGVLSKFQNLKLIATRSQGVNHIDTEYTAARDIKVLNANGYGEFAVSEFAMGLLISLMRKIIPAHNGMLSGNIDMPKYTGRDIHGKTVGVFGTGTIGSAFARLAAAFGARVIAYDRNRVGDFKYVDLDTLYKESDIVALNIPANAENYHIINADVLAKMKRGVIILNIARGELINARALHDAVISGHVGGVAPPQISGIYTAVKRQLHCRF